MGVCVVDGGGSACLCLVPLRLRTFPQGDPRLAD